MIVIDSSVVVAVLKGEAGAEAFDQIAARSSRSLMSAFNVFELRTVMLRQGGPEAVRRADIWLDGFGVDERPFDAEQSALALTAYADFGKGRHPARLNMGDCAAYALAKSLGAPLLYKGDDFAQTDIEAAA